jgi:arylsulfatase A-like enzyme
MTGRNSARHAVTDWVGGGGAGSPGNWRSGGMVTGEVTLPKLLKAGGYRTIHIGKAHFSNSTVPVQSIGFDVNVGGFDWGHPHSGYMGVAAYGGMPGLSAYDGSLFLTKALTIEANKALETAVAVGRPFFLNMAFYAVHSPFTTNPDATGGYGTAVNDTHRKFATMIEGMDIAIGQIRQKIIDLGVAENTLIVFLGDNGSDSPALTIDGMPSGVFSDFPMRGKKGSKWEGGVRVPLIACWAAANPANPFQQALPIPANSIETDIVTSWDLPVTLLKAAGLPGAADFGEDGHDLTPYLAAVPGTHRPQEVVIHYPHVHRSNYFSTLRQGDLKLIYNYQSNSHQLYNLASDPTESNNLAASQPETLTRLTRGLAQRLAATWGPRGPLIPTVATTAPNGNVVSIPNNRAVDVDADGLADTAEDPDLDGLVDPGETNPDNDNTDGDGTSDGAEIRTGTDPLNAASDFRGLLTSAPGGEMTITWPSKPGASYEIRISGDLADWTAPPLAIVPASGGISTSCQLPTSSETALFYQVKLLP